MPTIPTHIFAAAAFLIAAGNAPAQTPPKLPPAATAPARLSPIPPRVIPKCLPAGAYEGMSTPCPVSVLFLPDQATVPDTAKASFSKGELIGVDALRIVGTWGKPGVWKQFGSVGEPAVLWWGRSYEGDFMTVGYESYTFLAQQVMESVVKTGPQPMMELAYGKLFPFKADKVSYTMLSAPELVISGGLGGDNAKYQPALVTNAQLTLTTLPSLQGMMQLDVTIEGRSRTYKIPLKRNAKEKEDANTTRSTYLFRLRSGDIHQEGDRIVDCARGIGAMQCHYDYYDMARKAREGYTASGIFFGPNSEYLAVRFVLEIDIQERNKTWAHADGLVILRAKL